MKTITPYSASPIPPSSDAASLPTNTVSTKASIHPPSGTPEASAQNSASSAEIVITQKVGVEFNQFLSV